MSRRKRRKTAPAGAVPPTLERFRVDRVLRDRYNRAVTLRNIARRVGDEQTSAQMEKVMELVTAILASFFEDALEEAQHQQLAERHVDDRLIRALAAPVVG